MKKLILFAAFISVSFTINAQNINFSFTDNSVLSYSIEEVRKLTYNDDVMNLHLGDATIISWNINSIGYFKYDEISLSTEQLLSDLNFSQIKLYPNPVSNILNVSISLLTEDDIQVGIYNIEGKQILEKSISNQAFGDVEFAFDLSDLSQGTHFIQIKGKNTSITKQFIKQ